MDQAEAQFNFVLQQVLIIIDLHVYYTFTIHCELVDVHVHVFAYNMLFSGVCFKNFYYFIILYTCTCTFIFSSTLYVMVCLVI